MCLLSGAAPYYKSQFGCRQKSFLEVHLGHVSHGVFQRVRPGRVDCLLGLHGGLHHRVVGLEGVDVVLGLGEHLGLDPLAQRVLAHDLDDLSAVLLLGHDPAGHLVEVLRAATGGVELVDLDHGLADGGARLLDLGDHGGVVEDAAGDLAVAAAETEHEVEGGLLLDVVVREGAAILELLAREDQALLVGGNALLVLDLGLDVVDGVGRLNLEGDGLAGD